MKKRYAVLGLSAFLALALAVPAFGGPSNPVATMSASVKTIANKALKTAKAARKTANSALSAAQSASSAASTASTEAKKAQTTANEAKTAAGGAQTTANEAKTAAGGAQTTANEAKTAAASAKAAAEAANANANTRIKESIEVFGTASPSTGTDATTPKSSNAECPPGDVVLGGGYFVNGTGITVHTSNPDVIYGNGWFAEGEAISGTPNWSIQTDVMCGVK